MVFISSKHTIFYKLEKAIKLYRRLAQNQINKAGYDITLNQLTLLMELSNRPESSQVELSELVFKDFASVARMTDLMVKKKLLVRRENAIDRRKKDLTPTPKCQEMISHIKPVIENYRKIAMLEFEATDVDKLSSLLDKLSANCENNSILTSQTSIV